MISVREAHGHIEAALSDLVAETVPLADALNRVVAQRVDAKFALPRFTNAAMDGFAVRVEDLESASEASPVRLALAGVVKAGDAADFSLEAGTCVQVMTGAPLPRGTRAVVPVEKTNGFEADPVEFRAAPKPRANIRYEGEEVEVGTPLIHPGARVQPAEHGVLAAFGLGEVLAYRRPRIAIYGTGDELQEPGKPLGPGQIYNSNLPVLSDLAVRVGADIHFSGVIRDDASALREFLAEALDGADVVVASGGVSMGRYDLVRDVLLELGVEDRFWKVAQKPGKPMFFGVRGRTLVFGLPGNPVSSFICFMEYLWPTMKKLQGRAPAPKVLGVLSRRFRRSSKRHRFLFGRAGSEAGVLRVEPTTRLGSHMLTSALEANCILEAPPGDRDLEAGEPILIRLLPWGHMEAWEER